MYDPEKMKEAYDKMEHGRARMSAVRAAAAEADRQRDVPFQMYFREEICHESCFYGDNMDMMVVFPELLALADKHPDTPATVFDNMYADALDHVLWVYKWMLSNCSSFYQIPLEDCLKFFEDARKRFLSYGYNLKPWYRSRYDFYRHIDRQQAEEAFYEFERLPRDSNSDCAACERNTEINFYLEKGDPKKAAALSKDIENFTLTCGDDRAAWLRLKKNYMHYHMKRKEFDKALKYCRLMERNLQGGSEYERWDDFLACYAYADIGKALKIYKEHWRDWLNWRDPSDEFRFDVNVCLFFRQLKADKEARGALEAVGGQGGSAGSAEGAAGSSAEGAAGSSAAGGEGPVVKLPFDHTFPLYREDGQYRITELYDFYYRRAEELAEKFDARNKADGYRKELEKALGTARELSGEIK